MISNIALAKVYQKSDKQIKKPPKYIIPIHLVNKGLEFIHLKSILHENNIKNGLRKSLWKDEILSTVYILSNTIRNKIFNYKNTVNNISTNDTRTYGTNTISCNRTNAKYLNHHHEYIITGDLRIIEI